MTTKTVLGGTGGALSLTLALAACGSGTGAAAWSAVFFAALTEKKTADQAATDLQNALGELGD